MKHCDKKPASLGCMRAWRRYHNLGCAQACYFLFPILVYFGWFWCWWVFAFLEVERILFLVVLWFGLKDFEKLAIWILFLDFYDSTFMEIEPQISMTKVLFVSEWLMLGCSYQIVFMRRFMLTLLLEFIYILQTTCLCMLVMYE